MLEAEKARADAAISIHALREEGDERGGGRLAQGYHFYPRPPRGGRPLRAPARFTGISISIHALREEGDRPRYPHGPYTGHFYPRPPRGGRPFSLPVPKRHN